MVVDVCLHGMVHEYRVYLENLTFPHFSKLLEAARRANESVRKPFRPTINSHSGVAPRSFPRKRFVIADVEDGQEARPPRLKKPSYRPGYKGDNRQGKKSYPILPLFPYGFKKAIALLNQWVKDKTATLPHVDHLPSEEDQQELNFCLITKGEATTWSNVLYFVKCLTRSWRQERSYSRMKILRTCMTGRS